ncbi:MAG: GAF domain-containing SpoIIE family protein phosphatase [Candidatus Fermentibacteraceae bacterium]
MSTGRWVIAASAALLALVLTICGVRFSGIDLFYVAAGVVVFLGMAGQLSGLSLVRRLVLILLLLAAAWGLARLQQTLPRDRALEGELISHRTAAEALGAPEPLDISGWVERSLPLSGLEDGSAVEQGALALGRAGLFTAERLISSVGSSALSPTDSQDLSSMRAGRGGRVLGLLTSVVAAGLSIMILLGLRGLILVERRVKTLRLLRVLLILVLFHVVYTTMGYDFLTHSVIMNVGAGANRVSVSVPYILVLLWSFINGFRNKWIHYLSRSGKYLAAAGCGLALYLSLDLQQLYRMGELTAYSPGAGAVTGVVASVTMVYSAMSLVAVLLHLPTAKLLDKKLRELRSLQGLGETVYSTFDEERVARKAARLAQSLTGADMAWVVIHSEEGRRVAGAAGAGAPMAYKVEQGWYDALEPAVASGGKALLINNFPRSRLFEGSGPLQGAVGSLMACGLRTADGSIGLLLVASSGKFGFMEEERGLFENFASQVAMGIQNARLVEANIERERFQEELNLARGIQKGLLPAVIPEVPGYSIAADSIASNHVGGDYYDVIPLQDGRVALAIADVSGKGAAAALLMSALQATLHTLLRRPAPANEIVGMLNEETCRRMPEDKFITFFLAVLEPRTGRLAYCCAGHDPPLLVRCDGATEQLTSGGLVLGVLPGADYAAGSAAMDPGDLLVMFTDGVTETMEEKEGDEVSEFGRDRLARTMVHHRSESSREVFATLLRVLDSFRGEATRTDDVTALIVKRMEDST